MTDAIHSFAYQSRSLSFTMQKLIRVNCESGIFNFITLSLSLKFFYKMRERAEENSDPLNTTSLLRKENKLPVIYQYVETWREWELYIPKSIFQPRHFAWMKSWMPELFSTHNKKSPWMCFIDFYFSTKTFLLNIENLNF